MKIIQALLAIIIKSITLGIIACVIYTGWLLYVHPIDVGSDFYIISMLFLGIPVIIIFILLVIDIFIAFPILLLKNFNILTFVLVLVYIIGNIMLLSTIIPKLSHSPVGSNNGVSSISDISSELLNIGKEGLANYENAINKVNTYTKAYTDRIYSESEISRMLEILETDSPNTIGVKDYWCRAKRESWDNWIDSHYSKALVNAIENNNDNTLSIEASNYVRIDFILNNKNIKMVKESYLKRKNTVLSTAKVLCKNSQSK